MRYFLTFIVLVFSFNLRAETNNVLLIGFWPPTNEMLRDFSPYLEKNPQGWKGKNWKNLKHDVYSFFPEFDDIEKDAIGKGDFRVDFAATYNDFMRITEFIRPVAIIGFGRGGGPWEIEQKCPASFTDWFVKGMIPSEINETLKYDVPESLKNEITYKSTLPSEEIKQNINNAGLSEMDSTVDGENGAGAYLCGFLSYLISWYYDSHSSFQDPAYIKAGGFIHVNGPLEVAKSAMEITLETTINYISR